jgi:hypothetical protein
MGSRFLPQTLWSKIEMPNNKKSRDQIKKQPTTWRNRLLHQPKNNHNDNLDHLVFQYNMLLKPSWLTLFILLNQICATLTTHENAMPFSKSNDNDASNMNAYPNNVMSMHSTSDNDYSSHSFSATNYNHPIPFKEFIKSQIAFSTKLKGNRKECDEIVEKIIQTTIKLPHTKEQISRALNQGVKILCTNIDQIQEFVSFGGAYFDHTNKLLFFTNERLDERLINHEFTHADSFLRHQTDQCNAEDPYDAILPIFPPTPKNIKAYQKALDKGDQRIQDFKQLRIKEKQGSALTKVESNRLLKYKLAAKDCLLFKTVDTNPPEMYDELVKLGWRPGVKGLTVPLNNVVTMEILDVTKSASETTCLMQTINPIDSVLYTVDKIDIYLNSYYQKFTPNSKLAERDAFTFEHLSQNAIKTFYPEADKLRKKDIQHCYSSFTQ